MTSTSMIMIVYAFSILTMGASICWILLRADRKPLTISFTLCQILITIWLAAQFVQKEAVNTHQLFLSYSIANLAICFIGSAWLLFSLYYLGKTPPKYLIFIFMCISIGFYVMALTTQEHKLYYSSFNYETGVVRNFLFYINIVYIYVCMIIGTFNIYRKTFKQKEYSKEQAVLITGAVIVPLIFNSLYLTGTIKVPFDITPLAFSISTILILLATYQFGFLNVNSVAFERVFDNIEEGVVVYNQKGTITYCNKMMNEYFSFKSNGKIEALYNEIGMFDKNNISHSYALFSETEIKKDNKTINIKRYNFPEKNEIIKTSVMIVSDITKYYELLGRTKELSIANQKLAVERERNRIAQDVHDTIGHNLTMINSLAKLSKIEFSKGNNDIVLEHLSETETLTSNGIAQLRMSINNMRQGGNNAIMITKNINKLINNIHGLEIDFCVQGDDSLDYSLYSNAIYESCREVITNCLRYSDATRMDIILKFLPSAINLYIFDNGSGCEKIVLGNGLNGINKRIEKLSGTVSYASSLGNGFNTTIKIPLENNKI